MFMTNRRGVLALLAGGAALALPGCGVAGKRFPNYRYRLTVEVDTPQGLRAGSSVIEVSTSIAGRYSIPNPGKVGHGLKGEAVTVDLGSRGFLVALLCSDESSGWAKNVLYRLSPEVPQVLDADGKYDPGRSFEARFTNMLKRREPIQLPKTFPVQGHLRNSPARPMMVRFSDIADPRTIEKVDPDDLSAAFGQGIKLRRVIVQITDDPVTTGIQTRLTWLPRVYQILKGKPFQPAGIPVGDFQRLFSTETFK